MRRRYSEYALCPIRKIPPRFYKIMDDKNGILNIYKEKGYTSHDVVAIIRKLLAISKVGHTGTLDPAAEGVLPVCVGRATKLSSFIMSETKSYLAECKLGICTDTQDDTGTVTHTFDVKCSRNEIIDSVRSFKGSYLQTPPMYSAIKVGGKKLYELARKGKTVNREKRECVIYDIDVHSFIDDKTFKIDVNCSKGTYIRSLAADIGEKLGCGAVMGSLLRYRSGDFSVEGSIRLSQLKEAVTANGNDANNSLQNYLLPIEYILRPFKRVHVRKEHNTQLYNGNAIPISFLAEKEDEAGLIIAQVEASNSQIVVCDYNNDIIGIYTVSHESGTRLKPMVMIKTKD